MKKRELLDSILKKSVIEKIEAASLGSIKGGDIQNYQTCHVTQDQVCQGQDLCTCSQTSAC